MQAPRQEAPFFRVKINHQSPTQESVNKVIFSLVGLGAARVPSIPMMSAMWVLDSHLMLTAWLNFPQGLAVMGGSFFFSDTQLTQRSNILVSLTMLDPNYSDLIRLNHRSGLVRAIS